MQKRFANPDDWLDATHDIADASKSGINILALVKGNERYVFMYDDASRQQALRTLGRFASDDDLSFTFYDAAIMTQKIREGVG